ncbi:MAG: protoporphyrinogen oxidase [Planctomycetota bacterium]|nr:protoporphyrinogen oxidase [Planctomycetota bacterium]MEE3053186.1 protoporphyrinogen oxidase [Planctomycetota bacterium]
MSFDALVVGGGISGLSTAHFLLQHLRAAQPGEGPGPRVKVVEAAPRIGGSLGTEMVDGFLFERGPNGLLDNAPDTLDLIRALGIEKKLLPASPRSANRYLVRQGDLQPLPRSLGAFINTRALSLKGKLGLFLEPFRRRARGAADESVAEFGRRRLGQEVVDALLDPMVTGIYAGDVQALSMKSCFPRMVRLEQEHGSLVRGMLGSRKKKALGAGSSSPFSAVLQSFEGGLQTLSGALSDAIGDRIETGRSVESARPSDEGWRVGFADGREETARSLVLSLPAWRAANLFSGPHSALGKELASISYSAVAVVCLGYRAEDVESDLDGYGFLVPAGEGLRTLGMIWTSSLFPDHAPEGHVSIRAMLGGVRSPEVVAKTDEELIDIVEREAGDVLGIQGHPVAQRIYRYEQAIPQYEVGHQARLGIIDKSLGALPGLFLTGNSYRGVSVNDCIREGRKTAKEVSGYLEKETPDPAPPPPPPPPDEA